MTSESTIWAKIVWNDSWMSTNDHIIELKISAITKEYDGDIRITIFRLYDGLRRHCDVSDIKWRKKVTQMNVEKSEMRPNWAEKLHMVAYFCPRKTTVVSAIRYFDFFYDIKYDVTDRFVVLDVIFDVMASTPFRNSKYQNSDNTSVMVKICICTSFSFNLIF